jgi:hypothetical protein
VVARMVADLKASLSHPRLESYRPSHGSDLDMVVNYFWNIDLAEALVPSLHALEVALRNAIHTSMTIAHDNNDLWFFIPGLLEPNQLKDLGTAYGRVYKKPQPISGRLVAALMFGFWSTLLNSPYEQRLWSPNNFASLYATFPHTASVSGRLLTRKEIQERFQMINEFRNRVFHYERIYSWDYIRGNPLAPIPRTAEQDHRDIHEALQWISPTLHQAIHAVDNFAAAWNSRAQVELDLKKRLGVS